MKSVLVGQVIKGASMAESSINFMVCIWIAFKKGPVLKYDQYENSEG